MKRTTAFLLVLFITGICGVLSLQAQNTNESGYNSHLAFAQVQNVVMEENADGTWNFTVTIRHEDTGWDHYADLWQIVDEGSGEVLGERVLVHPHTDEQPFTRSLRNVEIPESVDVLLIRAKCNQHGFEGKKVRIPTRGYKGRDWEIYRNWHS